jgi:hypothetical protein
MCRHHSPLLFPLLYVIGKGVNHVFGTDHMKLACPARFERATYALEEFVAVQKSNDFNSLQRKNGTV